MNINDIIASSTALIDTTGGYLVSAIVGVFPVALKYGIPLALVVGFVFWLFHRRRAS